MYRIERKASPPVHAECRIKRKASQTVHAECRTQVRCIEAPDRPLDTIAGAITRDRPFDTAPAAPFGANGRRRGTRADRTNRACLRAGRACRTHDELDGDAAAVADAQRHRHALTNREWKRGRETSGERV